VEIQVIFNARIYGESKIDIGVEAPKSIIKMAKYMLIYSITGYALKNKEV